MRNGNKVLLPSAQKIIVASWPNAPIAIKAFGHKISAWKIVNDVAPQPVTARNGLFMGVTSNTIETITLVPYGCTKVRIVAFPVVR
jgi:uncharacterized protein